jgi:1-acyl-sn-glycerol-3-phosphate acyltransferase
MAETSGWPVYYSGAEPALDRLAGGWVRTAMAELGWEPARGERFTSDSLADQLGIRPQRRLLFGRLVELMSRWGGITRDGSGWVVAGDAILDGPRSSAAEVIAAFPEYSEVARLVDRGGRGLPGVLRGTVESQEVLFGDGGMAEMTAFYTNAPPSRTFNQAVGEAVAALVDGRPEGAPLRVLELGAGTGGTTSAVLPVIPAGASYTFTDISPAFLAQARERFADQPSMTYQRLDVEAPIEAQGFEGGEFDIVIASNVLHATTDLRRTLANVHRLLAPGGMLVALEITRRPDWVEVVFGLTDGWWMFGDFDIRPDHALLDVETWPGMLEQAGFEAPVALTDGAAAADPAQSVFVAQRPSTDAAAAGGSWLILADTRGVGDALAAALIERGARCTIGRAGDSRRRVTEGELELQPGSVDDLGWALGEAAGGEGEAPPNPVRLVQLWSLDIPGQVDLDAEALMAAQRLGVGTAVAAVQALVARDVPGSRLWMVTAGAQEVDRGEPVASGQAPVWGLGRVVVNEHSDLGATMIDLPPDAGPESAAALAANLLRPEREEEIAIRDGSVFFRRLQRAVLEEAPVAAAGQPVEAFRLEIATPGSLESLTLRQTTRRAPGPGEVEVAVRAAGLNFRDIMFAMGMLPDLAIAGTFGGHELGFDCAGVVTRVGAGVEDLRVGDDVFGFAPASFGSHAVTSAALLRLKPKNIGFEDAASVPIAFATAVYALDRLARVSPDDTVLIHAGTGGVGLAALQVARRAGARVLATAGSDEKRAYLRDLGVEEVMDSRSLEFADRVMELTEGRGVDVILNSLAGDAIGAGLSVMAPHGRFVELGKRDVYEDLQVGLLAFRKNLSFFALDIDRLCAERPAVISELLTEIADDLVAGRLTSLPASSFPIEDAEGAFRMMAQAKHIGKVVISIHPEAGAGAAAPARPNLRDDGTYIVTGGLGGFGVEVARWLAELGAGHLALLGRTLRPEAEATIEAIRATGVEVTVATADVSDEASLRGALHSIRASMPPIRGVVHAAMVLDDCPVVDLNADRLRTVLAPKMMGAWNLDLLTREDPLDHFILFSSIAAVVGNPLQGNYCAANVFLDALAPARRARGLTATTVAWGVLRGAGYVSTRPEIGRYLERQGYLSFSPAEALRALEEVLIHDLEQVAVARVDWPRWALSAPSAAVSSLRLATLVPTASGGGAGGASGNSSLLTELAAATEGDRPGLVASHIQAAVARVLGTSREKIDVATPFTEIGLDSLMAVELMGSLKRDTGIEVPVVHLLEGVSAEQLGRRLAAQLEGALGAAPGGVAAAPVTKPVEAREVAPPAAAATAAPPADSPGLTTARGPVPDARRVAAANAERALKVVPPASAADRWPLSMRVVRGALMAFFAIVARVKVEGIEHVPARGAVVVAGNHLSFLDAPLMMSVLKRPTTLFAGEFLRRVPVVRAVLRRSGAIFVNRGEGDVDAVAAGLRVLADGGAVGLAPEGARSDTGGLKRGLTGAAYLAAAGGAPIVPVVAYGQERIASNWWRLRRSTVVIRFGPAMPVPSAVAGLELRRQTDDVMRTLAEMLPSEYRGEFADLAEPAARP